MHEGGQIKPEKKFQLRRGHKFDVHAKRNPQCVIDLSTGDVALYSELMKDRRLAGFVDVDEAVKGQADALLAPYRAPGLIPKTLQKYIIGVLDGLTEEQEKAKDMIAGRVWSETTLYGSFVLPPTLSDASDHARAEVPQAAGEVVREKWQELHAFSYNYMAGGGPDQDPSLYVAYALQPDMTQALMLVKYTWAGSGRYRPSESTHFFQKQFFCLVVGLLRYVSSRTGDVEVEGE